MWPDAARRGISQQSFERFTAGLTPDLRIMDLMDSQPEFTKSIWDYLDILVNDNRLAKGREILAKYKPQFDAAERAYGVDRYVVAAIWGIESNYSTQMGDRSVLQSTATLSCIGRRQKYFRDEFLSALEILHHGDLRPEQMRGSWAGAFGPTQFMPTAFKRYAVDADGDGRRDVVDDPADLIASTANNLKKDGWQPGQTWGYEVVVPPGLQLHAGGPRQGDDGGAVGTSRAQARQRPALPASGRKGLSAGAGRRRGPGLPDAAEFPGDHEIQPGGSLCAGDRPLRRPAARRRRRSCSPGRGRNGNYRAPSGWNCSSCWPSAASIAAPRTASSAARPGMRCAASRPRSGAAADGFASSDVLERLRGH